MRNEFWHCGACDAAKIDDTHGVWDVDELGRWDKVLPLWDKDGGLILPPKCPLHLDVMENEVDREEGMRDWNELGRYGL